MGYLSVDYQRGLEGAAASDLGLSGFWGDCPVLQSVENSRLAFGHIYRGEPLISRATTGTLPPYNAYITNTSGTSIFGSVTRIGGGFTLQTGATDNDETTAQYGAVGSMEISDAASEKFDLWYECLVEPDTIAATQAGFFVGMHIVVAAVSSVLENDGALSDASKIGFFKPEGDAGIFNIVYQLGGQTLVTLVDGSAQSGDRLTAHTFTANAVKRLGFRFRPDAPTANRVTFFIDGVEQPTYVTGTQIATSTGSAFPDSITMLPTWSILTANGASEKIIVPCWGAYMGRALGTT